MKPEIKLLKNNFERKWDDIKWIEELYNFLQGEIPEGMHLSRGHKPQMSQKKAFAIIWYLQEHFPLLPDHIEMCYNCGELFDAYSEGVHWETKSKNYCSGCEYLVPENYDKGKR